MRHFVVHSTPHSQLADLSCRRVLKLFLETYRQPIKACCVLTPTQTLTYSLCAFTSLWPRCWVAIDVNDRSAIITGYTNDRWDSNTMFAIAIKNINVHATHETVCQVWEKIRISRVSCEHLTSMIQTSMGWWEVGSRARWWIGVNKCHSVSRPLTLTRLISRIGVTPGKPLLPMVDIKLLITLIRLRLWLPLHQ